MSTTTSIINDLIETLKDGQEGFRTAAEDVQSQDLKSLFSQYALQRSQFVDELQSLARSFGENHPESHSSVAGALHRGWIDLKSALLSKDEHAILAECERGEDSAVAEFEKALESDDLPDPARETVRSQYVAVKAAHDRVRDLRDTYTT